MLPVKGDRWFSYHGAALPVWPRCGQGEGGDGEKATTRKSWLELRGGK